MKITQNKLMLGALFSTGWLLTPVVFGAQSLLLNHDFEDAVPGLTLPGHIITTSSDIAPWYTNSTTDPYDSIEVIYSGYQPGSTPINASVGVGIWDGGNQFVALNSDPTIALNQEVSMTLDGGVTLRFLQRGGTSSTVQDFVQVEIWYYNFGTPVRYNYQFGATSDAWQLHEINLFDPEWSLGTGDLHNFEIVFRTPVGSSGNLNYIDNVEFGAVPEPSGALLALSGGLLATLRRRRER